MQFRLMAGQSILILESEAANGTLLLRDGHMLHSVVFRQIKESVSRFLDRLPAGFTFVQIISKRDIIVGQIKV